ncbi:DNA topoisomerase IB [Vasconcelosia minhoensis]|uniref:DNA topoisomerase IB n=1 Tax=Vasconcelosia minhoensis TaxID=3366354 RepID=UPI0036F34D39
MRYVSDQQPGIQRQPWGQGFSYIDLDGSRIQPSPERDRIEALAIPPSWQEVWICKDPNGHLQATGRDQKGRKQYRYHPNWRQFRSQLKFNRMIPFGQTLPTLREQTQAHAQQRSLTREKIVATVVQLLDKTLIRVVNPEYAKSNGSFGLTTLRDRHVKIANGRVKFHFRGKSGVEHEVELADPRLAKVVKRCKEIPGYELFQYFDEDGARQTIDSGDVNDYLHAVTGEDFTAKDFRTWAGTVVATEALLQLGNWEKETDAKRNVTQAIKIAASRLGNRPATCRKYYVHPTIPETYLGGELLTLIAKTLDKADLAKIRLDRHEHSVLSILKLIE